MVGPSGLFELDWLNEQVFSYRGASEQELLGTGWLEDRFGDNAALIGGLGIAIGAIIAAALPSTKIESQTSS